MGATCSAMPACESKRGKMQLGTGLQGAVHWGALPDSAPAIHGGRPRSSAAAPAACAIQTATGQLACHGEQPRTARVVQRQLALLYQIEQGFQHHACGSTREGAGRQAEERHAPLQHLPLQLHRMSGQLLCQRLNVRHGHRQLPGQGKGRSQVRGLQGHRMAARRQGSGGGEHLPPSHLAERSPSRSHVSETASSKAHAESNSCDASPSLRLDSRAVSPSRARRTSARSCSGTIVHYITVAAVPPRAETSTATAAAAPWCACRGVHVVAVHHRRRTTTLVCFIKLAWTRCKVARAGPA